MMQNRLILLCALLSVLSGCAGLYEQQPPAPVYTGPAPVYRPPQAPLPPQPVAPPAPESIVKTTPIPEFNQQVIPITPTQPMPVTPVAPMPNGAEDSLLLLPDTGALTDVPSVTSPATSALPGATPSGQVPAPVPPPVTFVPTPFHPIEPSASSSPAVGALVTAANQNSQAGNLDSAIAAVERARNIEPNNAGLYYKLALLRLKQSKPKQAEELAKKAAHLAAGDRFLKKHSWLLIAHARELQKDLQGAKAARNKADGF